MSEEKKDIGLYMIGENRVPVKCFDTEEWGAWMETANRHVADTTMTKNGEDDPLRISTVFLGLDQNLNRDEGEPPILYETRVEGGPLDGEMQRCSTWNEAEAQHLDQLHTYQSEGWEVQP